MQSLIRSGLRKLAVSGRLTPVLAGLATVLVTAKAEEPRSAPPLRIAAWADVQKAVTSHKGKVVVVDIWTTTCGTCREEFPKLVALRNGLPKEKLACIAVACDYDGIPEKPPEFYRARVESFLAEKQASGIDHVLLNQPFVDFLEEIRLNSTPAVLVYGRDGKLVKRFDNDAAKKVEDEFTMDDVRTLVEKLTN